ncbi:MAG: helix-turn-helix domain-containing protein [Candidatus Hydrogenedens sp.]|nr:helix-turn-helix domain-containing protein [Candidatus Hydrogenedens sp.]
MATAIRSQLPGVVFSSDGLSAANTLEVWRDAVSPVLEALPDSDVLDIRAECYMVDRILVNRNRVGRIRYRHNPKSTLHAHADLILLQYYVGGFEELVTDSGSHTLRAGHVCLRDWAHGFESRLHGAEQFGIAIPRELIRASDWMYRCAPFLSWPASSARGSVLAAACEGLWSSMAAADPKEAPALANGIVGLINGFLDSDRAVEGRALQDATLEAMKRFLTANLDLPELGVDHLCRQFGASRAKVYRMFQQEGGVHAYIRDQRLDRCYRELTLPRQGRRPVRQVAEKWGFFDASNFRRLFQKRYRLTPSEAQSLAERIEPRRLHGPSGDSSSTGQLYHWLQSL